MQSPILLPLLPASAELQANQSGALKPPEANIRSGGESFSQALVGLAAEGPSAHPKAGGASTEQVPLSHLIRNKTQPEPGLPGIESWLSGGFPSGDIPSGEGVAAPADPDPWVSEKQTDHTRSADDAAWPKNREPSGVSEPEESVTHEGEQEKLEISANPPAAETPASLPGPPTILRDQHSGHDAPVRALPVIEGRGNSRSGEPSDNPDRLGDLTPLSDTPRRKTDQRNESPADWDARPNPGDVSGAGIRISDELPTAETAKPSWVPAPADEGSPAFSPPDIPVLNGGKTGEAAAGEIDARQKPGAPPQGAALVMQKTDSGLYEAADREPALATRTPAFIETTPPTDNAKAGQVQSEEPLIDPLAARLTEPRAQNIAPVPRDISGLNEYSPPKGHLASGPGTTSREMDFRLNTLPDQPVPDAARAGEAGPRDIRPTAPAQVNNSEFVPLSEPGKAQTLSRGDPHDHNSITVITRAEGAVTTTQGPDAAGKPGSGAPPVAWADHLPPARPSSSDRGGQDWARPSAEPQQGTPQPSGRESSAQPVSIKPIAASAVRLQPPAFSKADDDRTGDDRLDSLSLLGPARDASGGDTRVGGHAPASAPHPAAPLHKSVTLQLVDAARGLPDRPVELTLNPEELGRVRLTFQSENGALSVAVAIERPETHDLMRRHIDTLAKDLGALGYSDVSFAFEQGWGSPAGQGSDDNPDTRAKAYSDPPPTPVEDLDRITPVRLHLDGSAGMDLRL